MYSPFPTEGLPSITSWRSRAGLSNRTAAIVARTHVGRRTVALGTACVASGHAAAAAGGVANVARALARREQ
jgi:hypothetical protein